ncbi:hypothetical protein PVAP13_4NG075876 [Panicum virgatum]|uniref:Uncharacterized protein n=1 Tax=Panicum virgatum TaxID=38727 RepID=A0A8T0T7Z0_PANVG|nr:hypothetical protein PVAP13_4NG075876 [Panicum virgatum]
MNSAYNNADKGVRSERPAFNTGIWEPDDEMLAAQEEEDLDCKAPNDCGLESGVFEDDEARVYHAKVYKDLPAHHHVLRKVPICEYCGAIRFPSEGSGFCCRQGKVNIVNTPIPDELRRLFIS